MEAKEQAKKIFEEAWQHAPSSGGTRDALALQIAIWCVRKIIGECGFSTNSDYWLDVLNCLSEKNFLHDYQN